jgi:hypothetical protein
LGVAGRVQREGLVIHMLARQLVDLTPLLGRLTAEAGPSIKVESHDFH